MKRLGSGKSGLLRFLQSNYEANDGDKQGSHDMGMKRTSGSRGSGVTSTVLLMLMAIWLIHASAKNVIGRLLSGFSSRLLLLEAIRPNG